jgi:adenosine deaminase
MQEYAIAAAAFQLDRQQLVELAARSIEYIFAGEEEKQRLRELLKQFRQHVLE